jgi:hypothetical protein
VSWRDPYFHHNPSAIDRLVAALTDVAQNDPSHRTRLAAADAIGAASIALAEHLSDVHPKDSTTTIENVGKWLVGRLVACYNMEKTHGWTESLSSERVHCILALGLL